MTYDKCLAASHPSQKLACQMDKALCNVGAMLANDVSGKVCTEIDPRLADDKGTHTSHFFPVFYGLTIITSSVKRILMLWCSLSADEMVAKAHTLLGMYDEMKVGKGRLIFRLPATWQGIQAAGQLESEGVATQVFLVYSLVQGVAAAQAGVSVVQPNAGRVRDWFTKHPNYPRDPKARKNFGVKFG